MGGMILYLWRHGKAEKSSDSGRDEDRVLAPEGRNEVIEIADHCFGAKRLEKPEKIFTSPYLRAKESAEMIQGFLACEKGLEIAPEFKSGAVFPAMAAALAERSKGLKCFAVVGHVPDLESFAAGLSGNGDIHLKTGGLVQIEIARLAEPFQGRLLCSVNPENISRY